MRQQITNYIRAGYPALYIISAEEQRVESELRAVADALEYHLYAWSTTTGLVDTSDGQARQASDPLEAVTAVDELPENSLVLLRDFHQFMEDGNPVLIRAIKDELVRCKGQGKMLIMLGCRQVLPPELEREVCVIHFTLPGPNELGRVLDGIVESAGGEPLPDTAREAVLDQARGLTTTEAENAFALSVIESGQVLPQVVAREKASALKKSGLLEVIDGKEGIQDIGGLDQLKAWLLRRTEAFGKRAADYGLPSPKGILILGIPGTGKSLTAKATAGILQRPLLKLDAGSLFGSLVGESETNLRLAIQLAEAMAPCVLWLDEIEKAFSGSKSSGTSDGGTSSRVFGSFISWLQEKQAPVFVVATANDVSQMPPELLRKGRFDELWFVDLPTQEERQAIWAIQLAKHQRDPDQYDLPALARASDGLTGAEIEQAFIDALYAAFPDQREPNEADIAVALSETVPLSRLMAEEIEGLRNWAKGRARPATLAEPPPTQRRLVA